MSTVLTEPAALEGPAPAEPAAAPTPALIKTELPTEAKIPWTSSAFLGAGVAAPSGALLAQAVKSFEVTPGDVRSEDISLTRIESAEDLRRLMSASIDADFNTGSIAGGVKSRLEKSVEVSERKTTILCTATITWQEDAVAAPYPHLSKEALETYDKSPSLFRDGYGDYFIAGYTKKAALSVYAHLSATDRESMLKVAAEATARITGVVQGNVEVAGRLDEYARTNNCAIKVDVYKDGVRGPSDTTTPEAFFGLDLKDVQDHVEDFARRAVGERTEAVLVHYHRIEPRIPTTIELDPHVFMEAERLSERLVFAEILANDLPINYKDALVSRLSDIEREVRTRVPRDLSCDLQTLHLLAEQLEDWIADARQLEDYRKLWRVVSAGATGVTSWDGPATIQQSATQDAQGSYTSPGWVRRQLLFEEPGRKVCGYQVIAKRSDNGSWGIADGGLGKDRIAFRFKSEYDRGLHWAATVWTVPAEMVRFEHDDL